MPTNTPLRLHLLRQGEWSAGELATADKALRDLKEVLPNIVVDCPILTRLNMELCEIHIRQQHRKIKEMEKRLAYTGLTVSQREAFVDDICELVPVDAEADTDGVINFHSTKRLSAVIDKYTRNGGKP